MNSLYLPNGNDVITEDLVWKWYSNLFIETQLPIYSESEMEYFIKYYREAGLLTTWRKPFFKQHYCFSFFEAVQFIFSSGRNIRILDLGCGTGTQSLFFALLGADVISIDMDSKALSIFEKRVAYYRQKANKRINISIINADVFKFDFRAVGPLDCIYSMFAFNIMVPAKTLIEKIAPFTSVGCKFVVLDGNSTSWLPLLVPSRRRKNVLSPMQLEHCLAESQFITKRHKQGIAIPPIFWRFLPENVLRKLDSILGKLWIMAISHQIMAQKDTSAVPPSEAVR